MGEYNLSDYDAGILIKDIKIATYFEECVNLGIDAKVSANWIISQILGYLYKENVEINEIYMTPSRLKVITDSISNGKISSKQAKELFVKVLEENEEPDILMKKLGMMQISDKCELSKIIIEILDNNPAQIEQYKNGKTNMFDYFVGQVMKSTRGQANPVVTKDILNDELSKR